MSQAKLSISVFLRLTFVSGWFVFSHVTSQAFDFCVFEIDVCEWVVRVFSHHKPSFWFLCFWDWRLWVGGSRFFFVFFFLLVQLFCTGLHCGCSRKISILDNVEHLRNITVIKSCCNSVMMLCWLSVKWLRLIYHVLNHTMQIPKYTNSPVSDTGSIEPLVYILQQFNNIYIWNFKVFVHLRTKLSTNKHFICMYIYVTR
jgi:hypothetical protein